MYYKNKWRFSSDLCIFMKIFSLLILRMRNTSEEQIRGFIYKYLIFNISFKKPLHFMTTKEIIYYTL